MSSIHQDGQWLYSMEQMKEPSLVYPIAHLMERPKEHVMETWMGFQKIRLMDDQKDMYLKHQKELSMEKLKELLMAQVIFSMLV